MRTTLLALAGIFTLLAAPIANSQPYPGCPWISGVPQSVCSTNPPVPGLTPGYNVQDGVPGTWGPSGIYTPIQDGR